VIAKHKKRLLIWAASVAGAVVLLLCLSLLIMRTQWFSDFVRAKIISTLEDSTGGRVEIGMFRFDPTHLTARIRNLVIHGTEPQDVSPLAAISELELRIKLFSGLYHAVDLAYLAIEQPRINLIVNPDGSTNIPSPKAKSKPSSKSSLATIVDLAVGQFRIEHGSIAYSQTTIPFDLRGENLRVSLDYSQVGQSYSGNINVSPLKLSMGKNEPLEVQIDLPITLERDAIKLSNANFSTPLSKLNLDASLRNLTAPIIAAKGSAKFSVSEIQRVANISPNNAKGVPQFATSNFEASFDQSKGVLAVQNLNVALGKSTIHVFGTANPATGETVRFNGDLALAELVSLISPSTPQVNGSLDIGGTLSLDSKLNYTVNGTLESRALSIRDGSTHLSNVSLSTPFHVTPFEIDLNPIHLGALGGTLTAKIVLEQMQKLSAEGQLRDISLSAITSAFSGHPIGYAGVISGTVTARSNLHSKGQSDLLVSARTSIAPRGTGVPVQGRLNADYAAASGDVAIPNSSITLPHSRIIISGSLNKDLAVDLKSQNLNDFLPAANFGASSPVKSLPVTLKGGSANLTGHVHGNLSAPNINAHLAITQFIVNNDLFDDFSLDLSASPSGASVQNGLLTRGALRSTFDGSIALAKWKPVGRSALSANVALRDADLGDLLALGGTASFQAAGPINADIHIHGTYGDPLGTVAAQIPHGNIDGQPFDGMQTSVNLSHGLISLDSFEVNTAGGKLNANGVFRHPANVIIAGKIETHLRASGLNLARLEPLQRQSPGSAGDIDLTGGLFADLDSQGKETQFKISNVQANLSATNLRVRNQDAGRLTASASTAAGIVKYNVISNFAGSNINIDGHTALSTGYYTDATATIRKLSLTKALDISGEGTLPVSGSLDADVALTGSAQSPDLKVSLTLSKANIYQEPVNSLVTTVHYTEALAEISSFDLRMPAGDISLNGRYEHPASGNQQSVQLHLSSGELEIGKLQNVQQAEPGLAGTVNITADMTASGAAGKSLSQLLLSRLDSDISAKNISIDKRHLGDLHLSAHTSQSKVAFQLDSDIAHSQIAASGESQLAAGYPTRASLTFKDIHYVNFAPFLSTSEGPRPRFDALLEGKASIDGPIQDPGSLRSRLELNRLEISAASRGASPDAGNSKTVFLKNENPIILSLAKSVVSVDQFHIRGPKTTLDLSGSADLANTANPLHVNMSGSVDLGVLQNVDKDVYSSGQIGLNAAVTGSLSQPLVNGKVELHGANLNYADFSNGLSNGNGVILLNGKTATIQNLTGESGGGKITVTGFAGIGPAAIIYNLRANVSKVRTRYGSVSIVSNAGLSLSGNSQRSVLGGKVVIERVSYSSGSDVGSLLNTASSPPDATSTPSPLLAGIRLDIAVSTASDVRIVTPYVEKLSLNTGLQVRGTAAEPGIVGHINVSDGQLAFFGNTYGVNRGSINFYDPSAIRPELNLSLETVAQGVDVVLDVTGSINNLKLTYRSDPPLSFQQIIQLLATNTTPFDATIASQQPPAPQQSMTQTGESAVLGQAVANPVASRVQRVFGLSQFKIDPSLAGSNGQPTAKVTLQQKIANNITFTYITDVTESNSEIIRVQFDLGAKTSAVALRDFNGNVSVELFHKFQVR
jgi:translocation and assembly module TamB